MLSTRARHSDLATCVEKANVDPAVHVIALSGNGKGFCGGYDLVLSAEGAGALGADTGAHADVPEGSPIHLLRQVRRTPPALGASSAAPAC